MQPQPARDTTGFHFRLSLTKPAPGGRNMVRRILASGIFAVAAFGLGLDTHAETNVSVMTPHDNDVINASNGGAEVTFFAFDTVYDTLVDPPVARGTADIRECYVIARIDGLIVSRVDDIDSTQYDPGAAAWVVATGLWLPQTNGTVYIDAYVPYTGMNGYNDRTYQGQVIIQLVYG
jgi:hypothetical protein